MAGTGSIVAVAVGAFIGTDIDDMVLLTAMFLSFRTAGTPLPRQIVLGQYLGFLALVAVSLVGAASLSVVPQHWVGLLGVLPLALGIRGLWRARRHAGDAAPPVAPGTLAIAAVTIANGSDNVSVYTPLFRLTGTTGKSIVVAAFLVMLGLWCAIGAILGARKVLVAALSRIGHILVPVLYVTIGVVVLVRTGVLLRLAHAL